MTTSARLEAHRARLKASAVAPIATGDEPELQPNDAPDDAGEPEIGKENSDMTDKPNDDAVASAIAEATKAANARFSAVLASDEYKGREALGQHLLAGDMSADDIISALKVAPRADAAALTEEQREAAEKGGRDEMQAVLEGVKPSGTSADEGDKPTAEQATAAGWKKATATANRFAGY